MFVNDLDNDFLNAQIMRYAFFQTNPGAQACPEDGIVS